jgi:hypothetical protein
MPEANDFHFVITDVPEPEMGCTHYVEVYETLPPDEVWPVDTRGELLESFTTDDPYGAVEAAREAQAYTLEERLDEFGLEWQREQRDRAMGGW